MKRPWADLEATVGSEMAKATARAVSRDGEMAIATAIAKPMAKDNEITTFLLIQPWQRDKA